jgi:hypothetical protein
MVTGPVAGLAGLVAMISVLDTTVMLAAGTEPKATAAPAVNPAPVIVTGVPPAGGPLAGEIPDTAGT